MESSELVGASPSGQPRPKVETKWVLQHDLQTNDNKGRKRVIILEERWDVQQVIVRTALIKPAPSNLLALVDNFLE